MTTMSVGVRELRQNLSKYLDRVKVGETFTVTEHGREVARLGPTLASGYAELAERYGATIPTKDIHDVVRRMREDPNRPPPAKAGTTDAIIADLRRERF